MKKYGSLSLNYRATRHLSLPTVKRLGQKNNYYTSFTLTTLLNMAVQIKLLSIRAAQQTK